MNILSMFGLAKQSTVDVLRELIDALHADKRSAERRIDGLVRENERLLVEIEQLNLRHEQTKRGAKVLAAAVGSLHGVGARGIVLNGIRK